MGEHPQDRSPIFFAPAFDEKAAPQLTFPLPGDGVDFPLGHLGDLLGCDGSGQLPLVLEELSECVSGQEDAEGAVEARELRRLLDQFIRELPAREGNIFLRRYFFTEPVGEIARQWGLTENHVSVLLSRTRKKLKLLLEKEGYL